MASSSEPRPSDPLDGIDPEELADLGYRLARLLASAYQHAIADAATIEREAA